MFYTSLQANEQIYHETYGGMCCISLMLYICTEETRMIVLYMTCSKPAERRVGEGIGVTQSLHSILTTALLSNA